MWPKGGWYKEIDCSTAWDFTNDTVTGNTTLYAKWTLQTYNITYLDENGANFTGTHASEHPTTHTYGTATTLKGATRTGYAFGGWFTTSDCSGTTITSLEATVYTSDITLYAKWVVLPDALSGVFTVNAEGKTVHFSKGNLQATIDKDGKPTAWKFAANQYVCLGKDGANESIGTAGGDIDLFGWSTEPTNYGINTSTKTYDYSGAFKDWGKAIGNGNTWRTLSKAEWEYLLNTRTVNGGKEEGKSYQIATINSDATGGGVYGMILYPDNYTKQT